mmetsp:Transcript_12836/g.36914  ORF Transcript_12836/g.36914 Transcript_12836/m.36914 type:complete len:333 (+) Transcript_12836:602-1600(+)
MRLVTVLRQELQLPHDAARDEVVLHIGVAAPRRGADEGPHFEVVRSGDARPCQEPLGPGNCGPPRLAEQVLRERSETPERCRVGVQRGMLRQKLDVELQVVLQVLSDLRQVVPHLDAVLLQLLRVADAAQHQQLRGAHGPGGENDLALCEEVVRRAVFVQRPDADGAAAVKEEVLHGAADDDAELGGLWPASEERPEVGLRRARAHAPFVDGHVHLPEALLLEAVVVVRAGVARLDACLHEGVINRAHHVCALPGDRQRALEAAIGRGFVLVEVALRLAEVGQDVPIVPMLAADLRRPSLVVQRVTPHVRHRVETRGSAQDLPARLVQLPAV